ncbi:MAG: FAD-dependent oxidoreductase, partial [Candidatus Flemingiibacterium sp.]
MNMEKYDIIIIGLGPAGAAAAIYSSRAGLSSVVLEGNVPGGQVSLTDRIDNYPGVAEIEGWELASRLASQAEACGARIVYEPAVKVELDKKLVSTADKSFSAGAIIIAGGAKHRRLGLDGEERLTGR